MVEFPLIAAAMDNWDRMARAFDEQMQRTEEEKDLCGLIFRFLNPLMPHFRTWIEQWECFDNISRGLERKVPIWKMPPGMEATVIIGYLCFFGLGRAAEIFLEQNSDRVALGNQLELLNTESYDWPTDKVILGTPLHIAAASRQVGCMRFLILKGADTNDVSYNGWTVLNSALLGPGGPNTFVIELLLACNANPNPVNVALTPLQSAVVQKWSNYRVLKLLLDAKADVNGVGNDEAVVTMIRYEGRNERERDIVVKRILDRGKEFYYDTPLRIVESRLTMIPEDGDCSDIEAYERDLLTDARDLLVEHGALSLHLPPNELEITTAKETSSLRKD
jgi:hypothetical protein